MSNIDGNKTEEIKEIVSKAEVPSEAISEAVMRLSKLDALAYEQVREAEAKKLNLRVGVLDKEIEKLREPTVSDSISNPFEIVEPWEGDVDPLLLLDEIRDLIKRFIICDVETTNATTLWIAFTWFIEHVQVAPIAFITAPEMQCGKSQLLNVIGTMVRKPAVASNITPSVLFRVIDDYLPTLLIDEADSFLNGNEDMRGLLNSGHTRDGAKIWRSEKVGDTFEPKQFSTWGAKAVCGIGTQAATIMDRSIVLELRRKLTTEKTERLRHADTNDFLIIRRKLARLVINSASFIKMARPSIPNSLSDRAQDNWEPLLAIADYAGGHWPDTARHTALTINAKSKDEDNQSAGIMLLRDVQDMFEENRQLDRITSAELLEKLYDIEDRPWSEWNRGKPITSNKLARYLKPFGVFPKTIRTGTRTAKGYNKSDFIDAISRYLPSETVTASQPMYSNGCSDFKSVTHDKDVTTSDSVKPAENSHCYDVTVGEGDTGEVVF